MPKILEDRRKAIARSNPKMSESSTWAIATSQLQKEGKMPKAKRYEDGGLSSDPQAAAALKEALARQKQAGREILRRPPEPLVDPRPMPGPVPSPARSAPQPDTSFRSHGGVMTSRGSFAQGGPELPRSGGQTAKNVQRMLRSSGYDDSTPVTIGPGRRK